MDRSEDKIISEKIGSVDTLPEGYEPNLESKWSVLETGLNKQQKKGFVISWPRIAAAAVLLLIGGGASLLLIKLQSPKPARPAANNVQKQTAPVNVQPVPHETAPQMAAVHTGKTSKGSSHTHQQQPAPVKQALQVAVHHEDQQDSTPQEIAPAPVSEVQLANATPAKQQKQRYVEMDFNDQPIGPHAPSEQVLAAQQFRFRLGSNSVSSSGTAGNNLRFHKTF